MADAERLAFEQMLVHNLKAPLSGILASLEMLHDGDLGELNSIQRSTVSSMQEQGSQLLRMIEELLDLARTEAPSFSVEMAPVDVGAFVHDVRSAWQSRLPRLTSEVVEARDVMSDVAVLRRVVDNLLMNALVHAGADSKVVVRAERAGDAMRITVTDDGPGVMPSETERIFEPFVKFNRPGGPRTHGLGLAYCRAAITAMDGTIQVVPRDRGASFAVDLPVAVVLTRQALEQDQ